MKVYENNKYCIDSENLVYKQNRNSNAQKFLILITLEPCISNLQLFLNFIDSEHVHSYEIFSYRKCVL